MLFRGKMKYRTQVIMLGLVAEFRNIRNVQDLAEAMRKVCNNNGKVFLQGKLNLLFIKVKVHVLFLVSTTTTTTTTVGISNHKKNNWQLGFMQDIGMWLSLRAADKREMTDANRQGSDNHTIHLPECDTETLTNAQKLWVGGHE